MTESSEPSKRPSEVTRLLFKAVQGLPEDEQRAVFEYFLERGVGVPPPPLFERFLQEGADPRPTVGRGAWPYASALATAFAAHKRMGPDQVMIPVRLSEAQHRRLKQWCEQHNFPMAVVVRGLIERFLDSWEKRAA